MYLGDISSQTPPHQSLLGSSQRCSTKNLPLFLPSSSLLLSSRGWRASALKEEGRGGANKADVSLLLSGVTGTAGLSERCLEVGVQDGFSIWRLDIVGSFLQFQQHGHLKGSKEMG